MIDGAAWDALVTPGYCWYNNDLVNKTTYGALYNYYAVTNPKFAPAGWHVPTEGDWQTLIDYLGGAAVAGGKLKEVGATTWQAPNAGATNESGFSARASGRRMDVFAFDFLGTRGIFWSSTNTRAYIIYNEQASIAGVQHPPQTGYSIRLVKD